MKITIRSVWYGTLVGTHWVAFYHFIELQFIILSVAVYHFNQLQFIILFSCILSFYQLQFIILFQLQFIILYYALF